MATTDSGPQVRTCLWFAEGGLEAAEFYVTLLPGSGITGTMRQDPDGPPLTVDFTLAGTPYQILNGGPHFTLSPAASIVVLTEDQAETDRLWSALTAGGGVESRCGWLGDRFGVSWQIVPREAVTLLSADDRAAAGRAFAALMEMGKIDIAALRAAFTQGD